MCQSGGYVAGCPHSLAWPWPPADDSDDENAHLFQHTSPAPDNNHGIDIYMNDLLVLASNLYTFEAWFLDQIFSYKKHLTVLRCIDFIFIFLT